MIDQAGIMMIQGRNIANECIQGVDGNMPKPRYHDYFESYYLEEREWHHIIQDRFYCIHPGKFFISSPYVVYHSYSQENVPLKRLLVHFSREEMGSEQLLKALERGIGIYKPDHREKQVVYRMLDDLLKEQEDPQAYCENYIHTLLNMALLTITRKVQTPVKPEQRNRITDIISYIHQNYQKDISIDQLVQMSYVSPYCLHREFRWYTSSTITQYMNVTRVMNVQRMFTETGKNITEINRDIGPPNITHLSGAFKLIMGMTLSNFRKMYRTEAEHCRRMF